MLSVLEAYFEKSAILTTIYPFGILFLTWIFFDWHWLVKIGHRIIFGIIFGHKNYTPLTIFSETLSRPSQISGLDWFYLIILISQWSFLYLILITNDWWKWDTTCRKPTLETGYSHIQLINFHNARHYIISFLLHDKKVA